MYHDLLDILEWSQQLRGKYVRGVRSTHVGDKLGGFCSSQEVLDCSGDSGTRRMDTFRMYFGVVIDN